MIIKAAKALATEWVRERAAPDVPGFAGACYSGSVPWLPPDAELAVSSDVGIMVVADPVPERKLGKFRYRGLLLDVSYLSVAQVRSPERVLADYHLAGSFRRPNAIADPAGLLARLQPAVAAGFAQPRWVRRRCEHVSAIIRDRVRRLDPAAPLADQVLAWVFATGQTAHLLLVAGLRNPTVRRRYAEARELLAARGRLAAYEDLLDLLGCAGLGPARVSRHLAALAAVFDQTAPLAARSGFFYASDLSPAARPVAVDGSRELIDAGLHREAVFWIVATMAKCQQVLDQHAPEPVRRRHERRLRELLANLGISAEPDLAARARRVVDSLPALWTLAGQLWPDRLGQPASEE